MTIEERDCLKVKSFATEDITIQQSKFIKEYRFKYGKNL
jgi:hypothetical protein